MRGVIINSYRTFFYNVSLLLIYSPPYFRRWVCFLEHMRIFAANIIVDLC